MWLRGYRQPAICTFARGSFNIEFTNRIRPWSLPTAVPDTEGDEFTLSVAAELPIYLVLPEGLNIHKHTVVIDGASIDVTIYQDCYKYYYGDYFSPDHILRYQVLRLPEAQEHIRAQPSSDCKYVQKLRSVVRLTQPVRIRERDYFISHQLRRHCELLMEACNRIMEAERSIYYKMAWTYPYQLSFLSIDLFWVSLYQGSERKEAFPFMGNAARLTLNPSHPGAAEDFAKITTAIGGQDTYPDWWLYYGRAATHHGQQNHRGAVLEAIIALEIALSTFVRTKWRQRGVSNSAIKRAKDDITLSMMTNIELMVLSDPERKPSSDLIGRLNKARGLRNNIVHKGMSHVSETEADDCLTSVKEALLLLSPSIYEGQLMDSIVRGESERTGSQEGSSG
jgi:hypothetical protein